MPRVAPTYQPSWDADTEARPRTVRRLRRRFPGLPSKALSIRQPWADLIVNGRKDIENRSWETTYRGPVLIHAGKQFAEIDDELEAEIARNLRQRFELETLGFFAGGIVGVAEIIDCVPASRSPWFCGPFGFVLRNARPLPFAACMGKLGFFVPSD